MSEALGSVQVRIYSMRGEHLGLVHGPPPVRVGDILAQRSGPALEVVKLRRDNANLVAVVSPVWLICDEA